MSTRLYVGNLSFQTTEADLTAAFTENGLRVTSVSMVADRDTGRPRGFAFVEMGSAEDAKAAIAALDGKELDGRTLRVNEAEERRPRTGGGGGFGRKNDRGRGGW
ncbi:MAG TPA: RNA-binding protein [Planctomycetota bacterium]|nr:RNA-binding protein [Planctomycetota bacterium]